MGHADQGGRGNHAYRGITQCPNDSCGGRASRPQLQRLGGRHFGIDDGLGHGRCLAGQKQQLVSRRAFACQLLEHIGGIAGQFGKHAECGRTIGVLNRTQPVVALLGNLGHAILKKLFIDQLFVEKLLLPLQLFFAPELQLTLDFCNAHQLGTGATN